MNKKTKTLYVVQPGGFGSGAILFSTYEFTDNSRLEEDVAQPAPAVVQQTGNRNWAAAAVRLPEVFRRSVWQPLSRRVQKLASAA